MAREEKVGLWAQEPPEEDVEADAPGPPYVASKKSDVLHKASCPLAEKIAPENLIRFETLEEAEAQCGRAATNFRFWIFDFGLKRKKPFRSLLSMRAFCIFFMKIVNKIQEIGKEPEELLATKIHEKHEIGRLTCSPKKG